MVQKCSALSIYMLLTLFLRCHAKMAMVKRKALLLMIHSSEQPKLKFCRNRNFPKFWRAQIVTETDTEISAKFMPKPIPKPKLILFCMSPNFPQVWQQGWTTLIY
jgi:hypothetical protein